MFLHTWEDRNWEHIITNSEQSPIDFQIWITWGKVPVGPLGVNVCWLSCGATMRCIKQKTKNKNLYVVKLEAETFP